MRNLKVVGFAELMVATLRANGISDNDILADYTTPEPEADAQMEAEQVAETGSVYAPAIEVLAEMRRLVTGAQAAA